jgi:hypothetical protein
MRRAVSSILSSLTRYPDLSGSLWLQAQTHDVIPHLGQQDRAEAAARKVLELVSTTYQGAGVGRRC